VTVVNGKWYHYHADSVRASC